MNTGPRNSGPRKPGFREIAKAAGVSAATVDRVLNDRGGVSPERSRAVIEAARQFGVMRLLPTSWQRTCRIELILPRNKPTNSTPFWRGLAQLAQRCAQDLPGHVVVHRTMVTEGDLAALNAAILNPATPRDALIIAADAGEAIAPALATAMARGEVVVTIVSDLQSIPPHNYCGVDNFAMGRTAGLLMRKSARPGRRILVLRANDHRREHQERCDGFVQAFGGDGPVGIELTFEDADTTRDLAVRALAAGDLGGIYVTGHTPEGLEDLLRHHPRRPLWISHELSEAHLRLLREGVLDFVLDQDARAQITRAIWLAARASTEGTPGQVVPPAAEFRIYTSENLPAQAQEKI